MKIFFWGHSQNFTDTILGHSQNFTDTVWIVGALGQAIRIGVPSILFSMNIHIKIQLYMQSRKLQVSLNFWAISFVEFIPQSTDSQTMTNHLSYSLKALSTAKVIHPKYSKHWPYLLASSIDCGCSKMLDHGLNHGLFLPYFFW